MENLKNQKYFPCEENDNKSLISRFIKITGKLIYQIYLTM